MFQTQSARALKVPKGKVKLGDYEAAAKKFCGKSWDAIKKEFLKHSTGSDTYALQVRWVCFALHAIWGEGGRPAAACARL